MGTVERLAEQLRGSGRVVLQYSLRKQLLIAAGGLLLSAAGIGMALSPPDRVSQILGWIGAVIFSVGTVMALRRAAQRRPQLVVTAEGIWSTVLTGPNENISWAQICGVHLAEQNLVKFVELEVEGVDASQRRSTIRLPHALSVKSADLAKWLAFEMAARGTLR